MSPRTLFGSLLLVLVFAIPATAQDFPFQHPNRYRRVELHFAADAPAAEIGAGVWAEVAEGEAHLAVLTDIASPGGRHVTFRQLLANGLPVLDGGIKVNLLHDGTVLNVLDNLMIVPATPAQVQGGDPQFSEFYLNGILVNPNTIGPRIDEIEALAKARWGGVVSRLEFGLAWINNEWVLVWEGTTIDGPDADTWNFRLSAVSGSVLWAEPNNLHHANHADVDTPGTGLVYAPCPLTTAEQTYGGQYADNNNATNASLDAERFSVTLQDLTYSGGQFRLEGPYVALEDASSPNIDPVTSSNGQFNYNRSQTGFEDVMCYHHIDSYQRYLQNLGFNNLCNWPLRVDAHGYPDDQSTFSGSGTSSLLRIGDGCVDDGEDADVILHEYGHGLSASASPSSNSGSERRGLDEGIGDYIAASYSRSERPFHWEQVFTWDGHNTCWPGRSAAVTTDYDPASASSSSIHNTGQWWSTAMMRAWTEVGRVISDRVFFEELYMNFPNMTLRDAALMAIDADIALYGGAHVVTYATIFCDMNLMTAANCSTWMNFVGAEERAMLHPGAALHIGPNPVMAQPLRYALHGVQPGPRGVALRVVSASGQTVREWQVTELEGELPVGELPSGLYHLVADPGNGLTTLARSFVIL